MTALATSLESSVWSALDTVRDPELDEPVTSLGSSPRATWPRGR